MEASPTLPTSNSSNSSVVVASFNLQHGRLPRGSFDLSCLYQSLRSLDADVVGLQEVDVHSPRTLWRDQTKLAERALRGHSTFVRSKKLLKIGPYGNAVVARNDLETVDRILLPRLRPKSEQRSAIVVQTQQASTTWTICNTHLSLHLDESEMQLHALMATMQKYPEPHVIIGDLNRNFEQVEAVCGADGWTALKSGATFPSWNPEIKIDHVLVQGVKAQSMDIVKLKVSDHCALRAELSWSA